MIHINCDVGEGVGNEEILMPYINACNIACGGHAGNAEIMDYVVRLAKKHAVEIGAHPSYPDRENFGRLSMDISPEKLIQTIQEQISNLEKIAAFHKVKITHIKPHGALYNDIAKNKNKAQLFLQAISKYKQKYTLYVPYNSTIEKEAIQQQFKVIYEAFADRNYEDNSTLVSRQKSNAVLTKEEEVLSHVFTLKNEQKVQTISGKKIPLKCDTFCVHSDTLKAVEIVQKLHTCFNEKKSIQTTSFPSYKAYGDQGILLTWEAKMTDEILFCVLEFYKIIKYFNVKVILDVIQSNNSILVIYNKNKINYKALQHLLERLFSIKYKKIKIPKSTCWEIPVCYDLHFGIDLEEIAQKKGISITEIISIHTTSIYRIFSIGFLPGFLYLGGLDKRLHIERKSTPRLEVKKGAVGIGGMQTGIYPKTSPGGWQILGNSPINFFDVTAQKPCFASAGDLIQFKAISMDEYDEIAARIFKGNYQLKYTKI